MLYYISCMSKQETGLSRQTLDKFYTKPEIVKLCIKYLHEHIKINDTDLIIEPSAGNGSFIEEIKKINCKHMFYDIEPQHPEIHKQDYLLFDAPLHNAIHILGNPPFGRQSSLAKKFIKKSAEFCNTIAFILPKSFKKDSLQKTFPLSFHLLCSIDLPDKSFLVGGNEHDVPCVFQIWQKQIHNRNLLPILEPRGFQFVKRTETPDISIRRVSVNAGKIDKNYGDKNEETHYFIKFTTVSVNSIDSLVEKLASMNLLNLIIRSVHVPQANKNLSRK